jgi:hypothetical protein
LEFYFEVNIFKIERITKNSRRFQNGTKWKRRKW